MDATRLRGLLPVQEMMPVEPKCGCICGVASIRGHDFPVVDLRGKLGIARGAPGRQPCVIAVEGRGARLIGFVADRLSEVIHLRDRDLGDGPVRVGGRARRVLDPEEILSERELDDFSRLASASF